MEVKLNQDAKHLKLKHQLNVYLKKKSLKSDFSLNSSQQWVDAVVMWNLGLLHTSVSLVLVLLKALWIEKGC